MSLVLVATGACTFRQRARPVRSSSWRHSTRASCRKTAGCLEAEVIVAQPAEMDEYPGNTAQVLMLSKERQALLQKCAGCRQVTLIQGQESGAVQSLRPRERRRRGDR